MATLVLPPRYTDDSNLMRKAAIEAGWDVERLPGWRAPEWLRNREPVLYGEPLFAAVVADSLDLALLEAPFHWLTTIPDEWLRRDVRFMTLADARNEGRAFMKPADDKCFVARVYESGSELPDLDILPDATPVLVSEPVNWSIEFRCFIIEDQLATLSPYLRDGELGQANDGSWPATDDEIQQATDFIGRVLADERVELPPAAVIDVGIITDAGWAKSFQSISPCATVTSRTPAVRSGSITAPARMQSKRPNRSWSQHRMTSNSPRWASSSMRQNSGRFSISSPEIPSSRYSLTVR